MVSYALAEETQPGEEALSLDVFGPGCPWERKGKRPAGIPHAAAANRKHSTVGLAVARKPIATASFYGGQMHQEPGGCGKRLRARLDRAK